MCHSPKAGFVQQLGGQFGAGLGRKAAEFKHTRLFRIRRQPKLRSPRLERLKESPYIGLALEAGNAVAGIPSNHPVTVGTAAPPALLAQVEGLMPVAPRAENVMQISAFEAYITDRPANAPLHA